MLTPGGERTDPVCDSLPRSACVRILCFQKLPRVECWLLVHHGASPTLPATQVGVFSLPRATSPATSSSLLDHSAPDPIHPLSRAAIHRIAKCVRPAY